MVPVILRMPALTLVAPVYALVPDSVRVDDALVSFCKPPAPVILPDKVWFTEDEYKKVPALTMAAA